ncbi:enoyl-[acyl-carrier-protein] reductase FabV [Streptomyces tanashiensis]
MSERVIAPKSQGLLFLDSHPGGCRQLVDEMWQAVPGPCRE